MDSKEERSIIESRQRVPTRPEHYRQQLKRLLEVNDFDYLSKRSEKSKAHLQAVLKSNVTSEELGKVAYQAELDFDNPPIRRKWEELSENERTCFEETGTVLYWFVMKREFE